MQYLLFIASIILYIFAPQDTYSLQVCSTALGIFIIGATWSIFKLRKIEFFGFNLLFTISFFACCYIFPVFIYNIDDAYSLFHYGYDYKVITKSTCLASIAYTCYNCGLLLHINKLNQSIYRNGYSILIHKHRINPKTVALTAIIIFLTFIIAGGYKYLDNIYSNNITQNGIITYFYVLITLIPVLLTYTLNFKFNIQYISFSILFIIVLLTTGSRTHPLALIIGIGYIFTLKHKISPQVIIITLLLGIILMAFIGAYRSDLVLDTKSSVGTWNVLVDLIVNNRNLFDAYSLARQNGYIPTVLLGPVLSIIPMGQSLFCMITGIPTRELSSSMYITTEVFGPKPPIGLGTNIVGDVYLGGGIIMVILLFYVLGLLISKSLYKTYILGNNTWFILYISLVTNSIFICRGAFFLFLRPFVWTLVILLIIQYINKEFK